MNTDSPKILKSFRSLKRLEEYCRDVKKYSFIFRGTTKKCSKKEDGVSSRLYRFGDNPTKSNVGDTTKSNGENTAKFKLFNEYYQPPDMETEIVEKAKRVFPANTSTRTILTSLQHFGGRTNLIDFSRNLNVALFFACDGDFEEDGELVLIDSNGMKTLEEINFIDMPELALVEPDIVLMPTQRVFVQHSIFVYAKEGYIEWGKYSAIPVAKEFKINC